MAHEQNITPADFSQGFSLPGAPGELELQDVSALPTVPCDETVQHKTLSPFAAS